MKPKVIAIGNRLMKDDAIGILVAERLMSRIQDIGYEVIIGETDVSFCLGCIQKDDFLVILDATCLGTEAGTIIKTPIQNVLMNYKEMYTQHEYNLLRILKAYDIDIKGYFIGIEISEIQFDFDITNCLKDKLDFICEQVEKLLCDIIKKIHK